MSPLTGACSLCGKNWREKSEGCARHEAWTERAAIIEEGAKVSRAEAERLATEQMARAVVR